jgi:threonine synthase
MKLQNFPEGIRPYLVPQSRGEMVYRCIGCSETFGIEELHYVCPRCRQVLLIEDLKADRRRDLPASTWHQIFDYRKMLNEPALKGIYRYHEFIGPIIPLANIVYLGEGNTPIIQANNRLQERVGIKLFFKNDGQNPSASFKDRGMASAFSYLAYMIGTGRLEDVLAVCASTGDTSAAAALYAAYMQQHIKSAVLLPHGKVTPQQLSQPLGSGAQVFEIPGVFDDCMKVVEKLSETYRVALLNSKNAWRILGQESYAYEIAQDFDYDLQNIVVVVPIGNAGNITAVMRGFLKFLDAGIITHLPKIIGVQSEHANPVFRYYREPRPEQRHFEPVTVKSSVAQAAMIGNPVSMPRVIKLVDQYQQRTGGEVFFVQVTEQDIMDWHLRANRNGHIACTHGGECLAGLIEALTAGYVTSDEIAILDSTAHALKFAGFQTLYFEDRFPSEFHIQPKQELKNQPVLVMPDDVEDLPQSGIPLKGESFDKFVDHVARDIADTLKLKRLTQKR